MAKALRLEPAYRYATVDSLKLDVDRALAVSRSRREKARGFTCSATCYAAIAGAAAAATAIIAVPAVGLGVAAWQAHQPRRNATWHAVMQRAKRQCATN